MNYRVWIFVVIITLTAACDEPFFEVLPTETYFPQFVDPLIGTANHGHVYPGATVPFGMVQLSPDNGTAGWDWCSGYNYADSTIIGFSHTHLSGTGIGDLYDLLIMPLNAKINVGETISDYKEAPFASTFSHDAEKAEAGYYAVQLDNGIMVELTATERVGLHRYSFKREVPGVGIMIDLGHAINWDRPTATQIKVEHEHLITGYRHSSGWAKDQRLFFAIELINPIDAYELADSSSQKYGNEVVGKQARGQFVFNNNGQVELRVGISSASIEGAKAAIEKTRSKSFDEVRSDAALKWAQQLRKIQVVDEDEALMRTFYTALYRSCLAPVLYSDATGGYKGVDSLIHQATDYKRYDIFSLWDTFRAAHPLGTVIHGDRVEDWINSLLAHYDEYGLLPVWSLLGNETNTMTGYHAVPVIVDAYLKGYRNFDAEKAFEAMKKSAAQDIRGTDAYREFGYIPYDKYGQSVTRTLEYAFDDWCIALMAKALNKPEDFDYFQKRAMSYQELFDQQTGFMRAKLSDGVWKTPFDPQYSDHNFDIAEYTEGNAWQHSWFVPHDPKGLIELHGGPTAFMDKLDSLFVVDSEIKGTNVSVDISGLIGQYAHGNEPSHHIAYLYNYAGAPWKTQEKVRQIMKTQYNDTPTGLCGNEDCGQMSAWYVWSALGLYPVNPVDGNYVIGSPIFKKATIYLPQDLTFEVIANNNSATNIYIQSATFNGKPLKQSYIEHRELMRGGRLELEMGPTPNKALWSAPEAFPPSLHQPKI